MPEDGPDRTPRATPDGPPPLPPLPIGPPGPHAPPQQTDGMAVASLVLGIVGLVLTITVWIGPICDVLAIVFGAMARRRLPEGAPNRGMATAGFVLGIVGLVLTVALVLLLIVAVRHEGNDVVFHTAATALR
jgi:Domain of unknown function (DUF4190)